MMSKSSWGLLGPESLPGSRRVRTLGLGAVVRYFNDRAVPGLGGVWFGKQIILALLGVHVAEQAGARNIEVANAVEALACWLAFRDRDWAPDPRLRGNRKLRTREQIPFRAARQRSFYVSQPMRMATVQTLPALGLVDSRGVRFSSFSCTQVGIDLLQAATTAFRPYKRTVIDHLLLWIQGKENRVESVAFRETLSPVEPLPVAAAAILADCLVRVGTHEKPEATNRRRDALRWVESRRESRRVAPDVSVHWSSRPPEIGSEAHWLDLHAGSLFFTARDAALDLLDALELRMPAERKLLLDEALVISLEPFIGKLRQAAQAFLELQHANSLANDFCRECSGDDPLAILSSLVQRDNRVLRGQGTQILPGPAFRGGVISETEDAFDPDSANLLDDLGFPENISQRIPNLYWLNLDLRGELGPYLANSKTERG